MDIAIIYNFAEHPGGGDLVALDMIEAFVENHYKVWLYTSYPQGLHKAIKQFLKDQKLADRIAVKSVNVQSRVKHPYSIYAITKKMYNELKGHYLVIYFDDIPRLALNFKKVFVYIHYPHAARLVYSELRRKFFKESLLGKIIWGAHRVVFSRVFVTEDSLPRSCLMAVNSTLTLHHTKELFQGLIHTLYPPVQSCMIYKRALSMINRKEDLIVSIGRIEPERELELAIEGIKKLHDRQGYTGFKLLIMGFLKDPKYLKKLDTMIKQYNLTGYIKVLPNVPRRVIIEHLLKAKAIIATHPWEQFGITVVEGMAAGCMPIVRRGFNGPWLDIVQEGRYGLGFDNPVELAEVLMDMDNVCEKLNTETIMLHALEFDEKIFKHSLISLLQRLAFI